MRAVIDTNVLIAGFLWRAAPHDLLAHVRAGSLGLVSSPALLAELAEVLGRAKFDSILTSAPASGSAQADCRASRVGYTERTARPEYSV